MTDYRIIYVDETLKDAETFQRFNHRNNFFREIIHLYPCPELGELIQQILDQNGHALVVDYRLSEEAPEIHYNGEDVVKNFLENRPNFPVFILTAYEEAVIEESNNAVIVNDKGDIWNNDVRFLKRIKRQIENYRNEIDRAEKRLLELIKCRQEGTLNISEEQELIELDSFLERSLDAYHAIPEDAKKISNAEKLNELLNKADLLLEALKK